MSKIKSLLYLCLSAVLIISCSNGTAEDNITISSLEDLEGLNVGVVSGSVQDLFLSENHPGCKLLRTENESDVYMMIEAGKVCATLVSNLTWLMAKESYPNIVPVGGEFGSSAIGFAFSKKNNGLLEDFNVFLKRYFDENDLDKMIEEWSNPESGKKMPDPDEVDGSNGTLHFAVSAITPPFEFVKNGEISGLEPEILARFAMSRNMRWDFADVAFTGLIPYIQSGKAVAGCAIMSITPERQQSVDFSIPWINETSIILTNRKYAPEGLAGGAGNVKKSFLQSTKESFQKSLVKEKRYLMILEGLKMTVLISLLAAILGTLLGMLLCFMSMQRNKLISGVSNIFTEIMQCMPQVVFLMLMFYVVFGRSHISGMWVAVIAFSLCFAAYTSVIFKSSVKSIDKGQTEAALSMGFSKMKAFVNVILPQTIQRALPVYKGEFIGLVKATSIVGYIAVFDLTKAGDIIRSRTYEAFFPLIMVTIIYFIVIWVLTIAIKFIEAKTQPKRKKFFK